ncbi:hypothetical protein HDU86_000603 [Geranomyces michiganensis]|nr:hypothetical protein HDU86_000603 [Geranomyces michiganensis]
MSLARSVSTTSGRSLASAFAKRSIRAPSITTATAVRSPRVFASPRRSFPRSFPFATTAQPADPPAAGSAEALAQEWFVKGTEKWNDDDIQGALECFEKSIWTKATGDAYYNIANCQLQLGKYEAAAKSWSKSIELSPDRADAHVNLANVHALVLKDIDTALPLYAQALRLAPTDGDIHFNYAAVLDAKGELEKAIEHYRLAVQHGTAVAEKNLRNALARQLGKVLKEEEVDAFAAKTEKKGK